MEASTSSDTVQLMKQRFYAELKRIRRAEKKNTVFLTDERYKQLVDEVKNAKVATKKISRHYWLLKKYDVLLLHQKPKLIQPLRDDSTSIHFYVCESELFELLHETHMSTGHGGRDRLIKELSPKYKNITRHDIELFLQVCTHCQLQKQKGNRRGVVKPVISSEFESRGQVDLIDFQNQPDGDQKFILVYQDHVTKFIVLKALKTKQAEEVAFNLIDIFTLIGAPSVLQSDNGRGFSSQIVTSLKKSWPQLQIVHGKLEQHGPEELSKRLLQEVENMLTMWMQNEKSGQWSMGLRFVQLMTNHTYHSAVKMSPYEALFGCRVKIGLSTSNLPQEMLENITSEEDLQEVVESIEGPPNTSSEHEVKVYGNLTFASSHQVSESTQPQTSTSSTPMLSDDTSSNTTSTAVPVAVEVSTDTSITSKDVVVCCVCSRPTTGSQQCNDCQRYINVILNYKQ